MNDYSLLNLILPRYLRSINSGQKPLIGNYNSPDIDIDIDGVNPPSSTPIDTSVDDELIFLLGGEEVHLRRVKWSPVNFYALPGYISINSLSDSSDGYVFSRGRTLYPMDISSALAVYALGIEASHTGGSHKVIDLCCSPGNKFQMISELLSSDSLMVGVDISESRLNVCKSLLRRYNRHFSCSINSNSNSSAMGPRQLVFHGDSTLFSRDNNSMGSLVYDSTVYRHEYSHLADRMKLNKSTRSKIRKSLKAVEGRLLQGREPSSVGEDSWTESSGFISLDNFDYAIVDAECTHDASYRHLSHIIVPHNDQDNDYLLPLSSDGSSVKPDFRLYISDNSSSSSSSSSNNKSHRKMNESNNLRALQRDLVRNGFHLLRPGGVLVYSTCSKDELQNEEIIKWLLLTEGRRAQVVPIIEDIRQYISKATVCRSSSISICSDEHAVVETSTMSPNEEEGIGLLQQELPELVSSLKTLDTTGIRELSDRICRDVASQDSPILMESTTLSGAMHISYKSGMSGLFIAKIRKAVDD